MTDILTSCEATLRAYGYLTERAVIGSRDCIGFEDDTVLGFILAYDGCSALIDGWRTDSAAVISHYQFGLRKSGAKAWNAYLVLLTAEVADHAKSMALSAVEEDLSGTRKIVRAGLADGADIEAALLPLLPLQSAPRLEAIDMGHEIRERTTELPERVVQAFLSDADDSVVLQILEETP